LPRDEHERVSQLHLPAENFASFILETEATSPAKLCRISRFATGEPYFGTTGGNRFDDPLRAFGTCYFGFSLRCAFAETVLHDEVGADGFQLAREELDRFVLSFEGTEELVLAKLLGAPLKRLGGTGELSTVLPYAIPQAWARAVHEHPQNVDGIVYQAKNLNDEQAVVVFDRARYKFKRAHSLPLLRHPERGQLLTDFKVTLASRPAPL
jgi:hypothetical protein